MALSHVRNVAFIGTGIMGAPIARHLMDGGYSLTVYNRTKKKAADLIAQGATWADSVAEAAKDADVVFTMVGYPNDVEDVYLATDGLIRATKRGAWMVDLTTSSPQLAHDIHDAAEIEDKHAVDCPVTGGQAGAEAGTLTLMVGGTKEEVKAIEPLLECFSSNIFYFGHAGAGQAAKLCNQVSLAGCMVGYAEALALAEQSGLDRHQVIEFIMHGMGNSAALQQLAPKSVDGDFRPGFLSEHFRKDLGLALAQAEDLDLSLPGSEGAFRLYDLLCQVGGSKLGTQAISLLYQDEDTTKKAGLDWSLLDQDEYADDSKDDGCCHGHGDGCCHGHNHADGECCGHDHANGHECHCHDQNAHASAGDQAAEQGSPVDEA